MLSLITLIMEINYYDSLHLLFKTEKLASLEKIAGLGMFQRNSQTQLHLVT